MPIRSIVVRSRSFTVPIHPDTGGRFKTVPGRFRIRDVLRSVPQRGWSVPARPLNYNVMSTTAEPDTIATLSRDYPGWHVWRGRSGDKLKGWYATRTTRPTSMEYRQGLYRTLGADDPENLRQQLEQQAEREGLL